MQTEALIRKNFHTLHSAFAVLNIFLLFFPFIVQLLKCCYLYLLICVTMFTFITDELVDRNCECCVTCCIDYEGWLQFQNCLYGIVKDPLFELFITTCIILNTLFLALEHHGMSENVRQVLDIGNKVPICQYFFYNFMLHCIWVLKCNLDCRCSRQYLH